MTDRDLLLRAVLADPADDVARLAYADACEEEGDPLRAAHVRHVVLRLMGRRGHENVEAARADAARLVASLPWAGKVICERGFVAYVECSYPDWRAHGPAALEAHPITGVRLTDGALRLDGVGGRLMVFRKPAVPEVLRQAVEEEVALAFPGQGRATDAAERHFAAAVSRKLIDWARRGLLVLP